MSLLNADLADPLVPYLDAKTMAALARAHTTFRQWARTYGRSVQLSLQYTHNGDRILLPPRVGDDFPCHAEDANGTPMRLQYRDIEVWPVMNSTYLMAKPGEPTMLRTERDIPFGSTLSRRDSVMTAALVFDDAERSPVPRIETPPNRGGWNKSADVCLAFTDLSTGHHRNPNRVRPQALRCINRLSSHFSPRAKMRLRITLSVARRPDGKDGDDDKEFLLRWKEPFDPPDVEGWVFPKKLKQNVYYTHYNAYSPAFYAVSRVQTQESIAKRKAARARRRALAAASTA